jgi:predicted DCC family thiol-disulfide oxidoreductase YuxK
LFRKIENTKYPPSQNILIWDGDCGFCKFWKTRWEEKTQGIIQFSTYQEVASEFPDIPLKEFKKASRLIEPDGKIYSGPDSAYRSMWHAGNKFQHRLYRKKYWFRNFSDHAYNHIAKNRSFYFKVTKLFFGDNPLQLKPYWLIYLIVIILILLFL